MHVPRDLRTAPPFPLPFHPPLCLSHYSPRFYAHAMGQASLSCWVLTKPQSKPIIPHTMF
ncbi:hypothetical protein K523DRAFT_325912 [Schizophyllum commune Tattone D]|nr:hypothetical protein K523DRAFT_325912 [Schizophyllum commune Tattone D]